MADHIGVVRCLEPVGRQSVETEINITTYAGGKELGVMVQLTIGGYPSQVLFLTRAQAEDLAALLMQCYHP